LDGANNFIEFWYDNWWEDEPLSRSMPILFELCEEKNITAKGFHEKKG
jgi:hypothetical protein